MSAPRQVDQLATRSSGRMRESWQRGAAWLALLVVPIPAANLLERSLVRAWLRMAWDMNLKELPFSIVDRALSWFGRPGLSGDIKALLWNSSSAAALAFPYVLLVVIGRWIWLSHRGRVEFRPMTEQRTYAVLGLVVATRLPSVVAGWGVMAGLNELLRRDEALATRLMIVFNEFLPWFGYALDKVPAALIALVALHLSVQTDESGGDLPLAHPSAG